MRERSREKEERKKEEREKEWINKSYETNWEYVRKFANGGCKKKKMDEWEQHNKGNIEKIILELISGIVWPLSKFFELLCTPYFMWGSTAWMQ